MVPEELAQHLTELHADCIKQLNVEIQVQKDSLHDLIRQTRKELQSLVATGDTSTVAERKVLRSSEADAGAAEPNCSSFKRKAAAPQDEAAAAERPVKRGRGRPRKQPVQQTEAEHDVEQGTTAADCPQPSQSETVIAAASEHELATTDEATSAAAGTRRRPTRVRAPAASATAVADAVPVVGGRTTRSRRGTAAAEPGPAAAAASSGRGRRARRGAVAAAPLEAIVEDEEQSEQQQQQGIEQQQEQGQTAEKLPGIAAGVAVTAAEPDAQPLQQLDPESTAQMDHSALADRVEDGVQQSAPTCEQHQGLGEQQTAEVVTLLPAASETDQTDVQAPEEQQQANEQVMGLDAAAHDSLEAAAQQPLGAELPGLTGSGSPAAAATAAPPKTPGFSLAPKSSQKVESDTPCFVGQSSKTSKQQSHQQTLARHAALGSARADADSPSSRPADAVEVDAGAQLDFKPNSALRQELGAPKAHSLSFGEPLEPPMLEDPEEAMAHQPASDGAAEAAADQAGQPAVAASDLPLAASAAAVAVDWKAFISTMHADDAPTPAVVRQRLGGQSGGAASQQQQQPQPSGSLRQPSPAAATDLGADAASAEAGAAAAEAVTAPRSSRRITRSSMKQLRSPSLQALQADEGDLAADGERVYRAISFTPASSKKAKPARSPRPSPRRSAKRSTVELAAAELAGQEEVQVVEQQQQLQMQQHEQGAADHSAHELEMHEAADQLEQQLEPQQEAADTADAAADDDDDDAEFQTANLAALADLEQQAAENEMDEGGHGEQQTADEQQQAAMEPAAAAEQQDDDDIFHDAEEQENADPDAAVDEDPAADVAAAVASDPASSEPAAQPAAAPKPSAAASSKAAVSVSAWFAATAALGVAGDKAKQAADTKAVPAAAAGAAGGRSNLVSGIRSFVPAVVKKPEVPVIAAGKVKVKVKALEAAEAARKAQEAKAQERAARQQQHEAGKGRPATEPEAPLHHKPQGTPLGAAAQSKVAAVERAATGLSGSGGAVRVPATKQDDDSHKPADKDAVQKRAEKEAEVAKRAMDKAEREDRMKRAEQKRKDEEQKRRQELAEKQRLKEERAAAAAAAAKAGKAAAGKAAAGNHAARGAGDKGVDNKAKQPLAAAQDPSNFKTPAAPKAAARVGTAAAPAGAAGNHADAGGDSPSLTIKMLEPVSTGNRGAKGVMGPPAPVGAKTPAAFKTPAPPVSEQEKRNVEALKSSPYVNTGTKRTPYTQQLQKPDPNSYIISPYRDDDVETPDRSHKPIPDWARSHNLFEALKAQQHTDPDTIFGARQTTCDLADMFVDVPSAGQQQQHRHKVRKLGQRTSSGDWSQDRLTWQEEVKYKKDMGYL